MPISDSAQLICPRWLTIPASRKTSVILRAGRESTMNDVRFDVAYDLAAVVGRPNDIGFRSFLSILEMPSISAKRHIALTIPGRRR